MKTTNGLLSRRDSATGAFTSEASAAIGTRKMNDESFAQIVAEDVKNNITESQHDYLMLPENRARWKRSLIILVENLEIQIANLNADKLSDIERYSDFGQSGKSFIVEASTAYDLKLNKIKRFKFYVENRLNFVEGIVDNACDLSRKDLLETAIHRYLYLLQELEYERTELDDALENALINNTLEMFESITLE